MDMCDKKAYASPKMDIQWFDLEDIISDSYIIDPIPGDGVVDDDDW